MPHQYEIGTLPVDGCAVTFGTARRGLGGCTKCHSTPIDGQCTNHCIMVCVTVNFNPHIGKVAQPRQLWSGW